MNTLSRINALKICSEIKMMRLESYDAFEPHPTHRHLNAYKIIRFTVYDRPASGAHGIFTVLLRGIPEIFRIFRLLPAMAADYPAQGPGEGLREQNPQNTETASNGPASSGPASPQSPARDQRRTSWRRTRQLPAEPPQRSAHQSCECGEYERSTAGSAPQSSPRPQLPEP